MGVSLLQHDDKPEPVVSLLLPGSDTPLQMTPAEAFEAVLVLLAAVRDAHT